jgi:methyl-accepting chemotaxis protein
LTIAWKLPLMIVGAGGLVGICVGVAAYLSASAGLEREAEVRLDALLQSHKASLEHYLASIEEDLRVTATSAVARDAVKEFAGAWNDIDDHPGDALQRLYIEDNPHPIGQKENLDAADDGSTYSRVHAAHHPWFRKLLRERDYYDVFLFDKAGNLVYSVFKEADFATNLISGPWSDTDLGNAFREARDHPSQDSEVFFDFRAYTPSYGAPASFISTPILDDHGEFLGVLAFQMPINRVNEILQGAHGLGETGQTYLVGQDFTMRSDSRLAKDTTILKRRVEMDAVKKALAGDHDVMRAVDPEGRSVSRT